MGGRVKQNINRPAKQALADPGRIFCCNERVHVFGESGRGSIEYAPHSVAAALEHKNATASPDVIVIVDSANTQYRGYFLQLVQPGSLTHIPQRYDEVCTLQAGKQRRRELLPAHMNVAIGQDRDVRPFERDSPNRV